MSVIPNLNNTFGKNYERLTGKNNYRSWLHTFSTIARLNGVWGVYQGTDAIVERPSHTMVFPETDSPPTTRAAAKSQQQQSQSDEAQQQAKLDLTYNLARYNVALKQWEDSDKRDRLALAILQSAVETYVWQEIEEQSSSASNNPRKAWKALVAINAPANSVALQQALQTLSTLKLSDYNNIHEYILAANRLRAEVKECEGNYPTNQVMATILNGLPPRYNLFVDTIMMGKDLSEYDAEEYKKFTATLIKFTNNHKERWAEQDKAREARNNSNKSNNHTGRNNNNTKSKNNNKDPRTCFFCGFRGHVESECRKKKQAIIDQGTNNPTKPDPPNFNRNSSVPPPDTKNTIKTDRHVSALATDNTDDIEHIAALSLHDDLSLHSDPSSTFLHTTLRPVTDSSQPSVRESGREQRCRIKTTGETRDWEALSSTREHRSDQAIALLENAPLSMSRDEWVADTGATTHICNDRSLFTDITMKQSKIGSCDGTATLAVLGHGPINITFVTPYGKHATATLSNVSYAPSSRCNLISIPALTDRAGITFQGDHNRLLLINSRGQEFGIAPRKHRLFCFKLYWQPTVPNAVNTLNSFLGHEEIATAAVDFNDKVWRKHQQLGHLSIEGMRKLNKIADGLGLTDQELKAKVLDTCPICATSKALNRIPREPARRHYQNPGELIHIDLWGPYPIPGLNGERYGLFHTDDATRYTWVNLLISRDNLGDIVKARLTNIERTHNLSIRRLRSDNEFVQNAITTVCQETGITHEVSVSYAHWQNGVAERVHRTVRDIAAAQIQDNNPTPRIAIIAGRATELLRSATLPEGLWPEAIREAVWKKNRSPTKALKFKKTPYEALLNIRPNLSRERAWGSRVYVTIPPEKRTNKHFTKLHTPRAYPAYFVATETEAIIRIWNPERQLVTATRVDNTTGMDDSQPGQDLNTRQPETIHNPDNHHDDNASTHTDEYDLNSEDEADIAAAIIDLSDDDDNNSDPSYREDIPDEDDSDYNAKDTHYYDNDPFSNIPKNATVLSHHFEKTAQNTRYPAQLQFRAQDNDTKQKQRQHRYTIATYLFNNPDHQTKNSKNNKQTHIDLASQIGITSEAVRKIISNLQKYFGPTATAFDRSFGRIRQMDRDEIIDQLEQHNIPIPHNWEDAWTTLARLETNGIKGPLTDKCDHCFKVGKACNGQHYGTNAVFFYLETVLFLCFKHRAVFF
jgi:hypothetical protein